MSISRKLACGALAAVAPAVAVGSFALASGTASARSDAGLPVLTLHMNGSSIKVTGSMKSGAVEVRSIVSGEKQAIPILVRLNKGVSFARFLKVFKSSPNDPNAVQEVGGIAYSLAASTGKSSAETVLAPAKYVALDASGKKQPRMTQFTITKSSSPAKLPAATPSKSIEFGFRGPSKLKNGTMIRGENDGWLVHMNELLGVKSAKDGRKLIKLFKQGKTSRKAAAPYLNGAFYDIFDPMSHGAIVQRAMHTKPGYYVQACFMDTQDGREHVVLGMERLVHVVK